MFILKSLPENEVNRSPAKHVVAGSSLLCTHLLHMQSLAYNRVARVSYVSQKGNEYTSMKSRDKFKFAIHCEINRQLDVAGRCYVVYASTNPLGWN